MSKFINLVFFLFFLGLLIISTGCSESDDDMIFTRTAKPTFSPAAGTYEESQLVTISCSTHDAVIRYTMDGSKPTVSSPVYYYPINVSQATTIKAFASKRGQEESDIATAEYVILPVKR